MATKFLVEKMMSCLWQILQSAALILLQEQKGYYLVARSAANRQPSAVIPFQELPQLESHLPKGRDSFLGYFQPMDDYHGLLATKGTA